MSHLDADGRAPAEVSTDPPGPQSLIWNCAVVIPAHPARGSAADPSTLLGRAVASVYAQEAVKPWCLCIAMDTGGNGAGPTRQMALNEALGKSVDFVTFLDSDDTWYPHHLATHRRLLCGDDPERDQDLADVAYSWFEGNSIARDWEKTHRGKTWDPAAPHHTTMTITVRASFAKKMNFIIPDMHEDWTGEDWAGILQLNEAGARFVGTGEVTWHYAVHGGNTSGSPRRGDAQ